MLSIVLFTELFRKAKYIIFSNKHSKLLRLIVSKNHTKW